MYKAILDGKKPKIVTDVLEWAEWFEEASKNGKRHVAKDEFNGVLISTVFLGVDHSFCGKKPLWFESMIFGGPLDGEQQRYETWDEAEKGHKELVRKTVMALGNQDQH